MQAADQNRLPALIFLSALSRVPEGFAHFFTTPLEQIIRETDNHDIKRAEQLFVKSDRLFCFLRENPKRLISSGRQSYLRKSDLAVCQVKRLSGIEQSEIFLLCVFSYFQHFSTLRFDNLIRYYCKLLCALYGFFMFFTLRFFFPCDILFLRRRWSS